MLIVKKYWLAVLIALILLATPLLSMLLSSAFGYCINHDGQYPTTQHEKEGTPRIFISNPNPIRVFYTCAGSFANENGNAITALATVLLFIVTGGLVWIGFRQEFISKRQLRAYITIKQSELFAGTVNGIMIEPRRQIFAGCRPVCEMVFSNSGQTPAYDVEMIGTIGLVKWPVNAADFEAITIPSSGSKNIIGPGETRSKWDIPREDIPALTVDDIDGLFKGRLAIVVFGEVRYKNIFKDKCFLRYRYFTGGPTSLRGTMLAAHNEGNEADYSE